MNTKHCTSNEHAKGLNIYNVFLPFFKPAISQTAWSNCFSAMYGVANVLPDKNTVFFVPPWTSMRAVNLYKHVNCPSCIRTLYTKRVALRENTKKRRQFTSRLITISFLCYHASGFMVHEKPSQQRSNNSKKWLVSEHLLFHNTHVGNHECSWIARTFLRYFLILFLGWLSKMTKRI